MASKMSNKSSAWRSNNEPKKLKLAEVTECQPTRITTVWKIVLSD